jgi:hypothetical protein
MRGHPSGCSVGLLLGLAFASACDPDVIGYAPRVVSGHETDGSVETGGTGGASGEPDRSRRDCRRADQDDYVRLIKAIFSLEQSCELPLFLSDPRDSWRDSLPVTGNGNSSKELVCPFNPFAMWQEPSAKKWVFCEYSCLLFQKALNCALLKNPCRADDEDAGAPDPFCTPAPPPAPPGPPAPPAPPGR